jgi:uncharacterized damage-inducible protein DinB
MAISDALLPEFDHEMAGVRKTLERVPDDKLGWKPHPRSNTMGWLASHLANIPMWAVMAIEKDSIDLAPAGEPPPRTQVAASSRDVLDSFDKNVAAARAAIAGAGDAKLFESWSLLKGGATVLTMPRVAVLRSFVMNHIIHHRAQMGVYLRLNDLPVPALYGPSADEG